MQMQDTYTMTLVQSQTGWLVRTDDPHTLELFGTDTLPTPYTAAAPASMVLQAIKALNPGRIVRLAL